MMKCRMHPIERTKKMQDSTDHVADRGGPKAHAKWGHLPNDALLHDTDWKSGSVIHLEEPLTNHKRSTPG
jgi:hypothetical protein